MPETSAPKPTVPYRQIRANYDSNTIIVYQAYSNSIASAAVAAQSLGASPLFKRTRMTWIKPSWCWMLYRAGYSFKDAGQERILAIKMTHEGFLKMLRRAELTTEHKDGEEPVSGKKDEGKGAVVKVQWDPERGPRLEKLTHRSIQIGIPQGLIEKWTVEWIVGIEDVTEKAKKLKEYLDEHSDATVETLVAEGLVPEERPFELPEDLVDLLRMRSNEE